MPGGIPEWDLISAPRVEPAGVPKPRFGPLTRAGIPGLQAAQVAEPVGGGLPPVNPNETLDLGVALRLAGVDNPTINLARERIREALAEQLGARSLLLPTINIGGNYHLHRGTLQTSFGVIRSVDSQSLYMGFGARTLAAESVAFPGVRLFAHLGDAVFEPLAARQRVSARASDAQATQNEILLNVSTAYLTLAGAEARLDILKRGEIDSAEVTRLTEAYAKAGQGRKGDANRAAAVQDLIRRQIRAAEEEVAVASARLCQLLNLDPSVQLRTPGGAIEPFRLVPEDSTPDPLLTTALRARPEVFARSAEILEAQVRVRQEKVRPLVPTISVGFSGGLFGGGSNLVASQFGPLGGRTDFDVFAVWNIQNLGFGNRALVRRASAVVGETTAEYDATVNRIRREVIDGLAGARAAKQKLELAKASLANSIEGFKLEVERIRDGLGRPIELLDSFRQLLDSRQEFMRAVVNFDIAQFRLFVAVGSNPLAGQDVVQPVPPAEPIPPAGPGKP